MAGYGKWLAGIALCALTFATQIAHAGVLYNGWNYAIDSLNDGSGGDSYEMRGLAYKQTANGLTFAVSSGMPLAGISNGGAQGGNIAMGDLFLNFSGSNLNSAAAFNNSLVYGVHFVTANDAGVTTLGVYKNITTTGVAAVNVGYGTLQDYINAGYGRTTNAMGDLQSSTGDVQTYLGNGVMQNVIASGTNIGGLTSLTRTDLNGLGLDFGHFAGADPAGNAVYGFTINSNLLPSGSFTAHVFEECINDGVAINGTNSVPEPGTVAMLGSGALTLGAIALRRRKR